MTTVWLIYNWINKLLSLSLDQRDESLFLLYFFEVRSLRFICSWCFLIKVSADESAQSRK